MKVKIWQGFCESWALGRAVELAGDRGGGGVAVGHLGLPAAASCPRLFCSGRACSRGGPGNGGRSRPEVGSVSFPASLCNLVQFV